MMKCQGFEPLKNEIEERNRKLKENEEYIKIIQFDNKYFKK